MTDGTIAGAEGPRNPEDYTGDCCLLIRAPRQTRHTRREVLIEAADLPLVAMHDWRAYHKIKGSKSLKGAYVVRFVSTGFLKFEGYQLHRELMKPPPGMLVDHQHRNPQDNRRRFLRICDHHQNACNKAKVGKRRGRFISRYKGVTWECGSAPWVANATVRGLRHRLGRFYTQEQAAYAYNEFVKIHHGEFAYLNVLKPTKYDPAINFNPRRNCGRPAKKVPPVLAHEESGFRDRGEESESNTQSWPLMSFRLDFGPVWPE